MLVSKINGSFLQNTRIAKQDTCAQPAKISERLRDFDRRGSAEWTNPSISDARMPNRSVIVESCKIEPGCGWTCKIEKYRNRLFESGAMSEIPQTSQQNNRSVAPYVVDGLRHVLGNTCRIGRTAISYAWNVTGAGARGASACFEEQSVELFEAVHDIAKHIRGLGMYAVFDYSDKILSLQPPGANEIPDVATMLEHLRVGHEQACLSIEAATDVARECQEDATVHLLSARLSAHRGHLWRTVMEYPANSDALNSNQIVQIQNGVQR